MSLAINTNIDAINAHRSLINTESSLSKSMERLSSGLRINSASDDAAGLAISQKLTGQINGLDQAQRNAQDGVSLVQTADGTLNEVQQMLQRIRELAVQYNNGTLSTANQGAIASEVAQLTAEIVRVGTVAQFNGISLFGSATTITFQVGANSGEVLGVNTVTVTSMVSGFTGLSGNANAISQIDAAIDSVSASRAAFGAVQNRLSYTLGNLSISSQNLSAARSGIQDVDMAAEMTSFTQEQILQQAGTSMLAQANQEPQAILKLLQ